MSKRPLVGASALVLVAGVAFGVLARAQPQSFPDPTEVTPAGLTMQSQEPPTGFTGACLLDHMTYAPALPAVCYAPGTQAQYGAGTTPVSFPAAKVARSYEALPVTYDSYQALVTCFPHTMAGTCPTGSFAISRSCCDYGTVLTSTDGQTAKGLASFQ
jgi:hypothetical protein